MSSSSHLEKCEREPEIWQPIHLFPLDVNSLFLLSVRQVLPRHPFGRAYAIVRFVCVYS